MKIEVFLRHCYMSPNQALPNRKVKDMPYEVTKDIYDYWK